MGDEQPAPSVAVEAPRRAPLPGPQELAARTEILAIAGGSIVAAAALVIAWQLGYLEHWLPLILSLQVALVAMIVALVVGVGLALLLQWKRLPAADFWDALISAPLVLPPTVLGYYILVSLGRDSALGRGWHWLTGGELTFSFTGAVIAAAVGSLPLVVRSVRVGLEAVDASFINAARTLGAKPARVVFTIVLPLAAPSIVAGGMLAFARALGDYGITSMVAGGRFDGFDIEASPPASIYVINEVIANHEASARNMALATTAIGVLMLYLVNRISRRMHYRG